jgi:hypothetical protein
LNPKLSSSEWAMLRMNMTYTSHAGCAVDNIYFR